MITKFIMFVKEHLEQFTANGIGVLMLIKLKVSETIVNETIHSIYTIATAIVVFFVTLILKKECAGWYDAIKAWIRNKRDKTKQKFKRKQYGTK